MAFDQQTRNRLANFVGKTRDLLSDEFTKQCQNLYGLDPVKGTVSDLSSLSQLNDAQIETAKILRSTLEHYMSTSSKKDQKAIKDNLTRIVREQAFTILNRLSALRMAEARGLLLEVISSGYQSQGFQLYQQLAGSSLGETGDAYRQFLFSTFDELSLDLPMLFDRFSSQGRLFPREAVLLSVLNEVNHSDLESLWGEDETIGWIYQYFNSQEERKAMRKASSAPRNSRELAVRNQFFTPRYVVEFLTDNSLGRFWFEVTGGKTVLRDKCEYLLIKPDEAPDAKQQIRDPRTLKLLDPACGSMHFGLYAYDLLYEIYKEAWHWENENGVDSLNRDTDDLLNPLSTDYDNWETFILDVPRLIVEKNIYGVDIDPRATQIASMALWLKAQKSWYDQGVKANDRPNIENGNIVAAVAPPKDRELEREFAKNLDSKDAELFSRTLDLLFGLPEHGVILKIEKEIPLLIREIYGEQGPIFSEADYERWKSSEKRLQKALYEFIHESNVTYKDRLFVKDAQQVLDLIDITRERFDVVVMNPPFGALNKGSKKYIEEAYPNSSNDLLAVFVERGLDLLCKNGLLGAITSRTCFFLSSFSDWRNDVILNETSLNTIADLGQGVMDDAMVEAAAYVIRNKKNVQTPIEVIRAIAAKSQFESLSNSINNYRNGNYDEDLFECIPESFKMLPDSPFVYWLDNKIVDKVIKERKTFDEIADANVGLSTADNPRFVRLFWEVNSRDHHICYYPINKNYCNLNDPIIDSHNRRTSGGKKKWAYFVMGGTSQPWYSPLTAMVNWEYQGAEMKNFVTETGKPRATIRNESYYFKPGFSWTRRAVRFYPYLIPSNCIHSASRYMAFPETGFEIKCLILSASKLSSAFMRFYGEKFEFPNFLVDNIKNLPLPELSENIFSSLLKLVNEEIINRRRAYHNFEPYIEFIVPDLIFNYSDRDDPLSYNPKSLLGDEGEKLIASAFGISFDEANQIYRDLGEAIEHQMGEVNDVKTVINRTKVESYEDLVSYFVGCAFGRWDIRFATEEKEKPKLNQPFDPLPPHPIGMLTNKKGLPISSISEIDKYPVAINSDGILSNFEDDNYDIIDLIRLAMVEIYPDKFNEIELDICKNLKCQSLREYFDKSNGFFKDHLKRYSKNSRKAPIYWPLSSNSGNYIIWLYYPWLNDQTLYTAVNDFIEPKLKHLQSDLENLKNKREGRSRYEEIELEELLDFEKELIEFRDKLMAIAPDYKPNHDDGVEISAAPLWSLFSDRSWQRNLKKVWDELEDGEYDWSYLAMNYWPERVLKSCHMDRSFAIAHGLEELLWEEVEVEKKGRGGKIKTVIEWRPKDLTETELNTIIESVKN